MCQIQAAGSLWLIDSRLPEGTGIGQPLAEVLRSSLSVLVLRGSHRGICVKAFASEGFLQAQFVLNPFQQQASQLITGCCTLTNREVEKRLWISSLVAFRSLEASLVGPHRNA